MTFSTITTALAQGYSISKIIKSILAMNTPLAKSIKEALKQGYNEDEIGEYLEKGKSASYSQKNKMLQGRTEEEKARGIAYREPKAQRYIRISSYGSSGCGGWICGSSSNRSSFRKCR
jgi:hypothetical protein